MNQYEQIREINHDNVQIEAEAEVEGWFREILIMLAGLSSLLGFWIIFTLYQYQGDKCIFQLQPKLDQKCYHLDKPIYYYYHYLFMSSGCQLQLILYFRICFFILIFQRFCIHPAKYKSHLKKQLIFQQWDTGITVILLLILYCFVYSMRRQCHLESTRIIFLAYTFWEMILFSILIGI